MIQDTSLNAYKEIKEIGTKQKQVYDCLKRLVVACNQDIAQELNWQINSVTPRLNELRNKCKLVGYSHSAIHPKTKRKVHYWKVVR